MNINTYIYFLSPPFISRFNIKTKNIRFEYWALAKYFFYSFIYISDVKPYHVETGIENFYSIWITFLWVYWIKNFHSIYVSVSILFIIKLSISLKHNRRYWKTTLENNKSSQSDLGIRKQILNTNKY